MDAHCLLRGQEPQNGIMNESKTGMLSVVLDGIERADSMHGRKLRKRLSSLGEGYQARAEAHFSAYDQAMRLEGKSISFGLECYLQMCSDMQLERLNFLRSGRYANTSYKEVEKRIYGNPRIMDYHMHGLAMAQFLWVEQYERLNFFCENLPRFTETARTYLEIGGGHGLYAKEALLRLHPECSVDIVDISESSLKLAKQLIGPSRIRYTLSDVFEYQPGEKYNFITMAEVIEHVEQPADLLRRVGHLLQSGGAAFITTPINAPMIDHIYLFSNPQEIRELFASCGFRIATEKIVPSEDFPEPKAIAQRIPIMYAAFLNLA